MFLDLEIWPKITNFNITSNTSEDRRTLICKGKQPIKWYFRQYDGNLEIKKVRPI